jgi:ER-bound oxygenase mpaB/B'/Rubber oxygenase, catalytic domain
MKTEYFVREDSIVRKIWGKSDTVLFIFAGAAAEFSLNKAVDWLYFTGRLPADPINRLFSTVAYARAIIFSEKSKALQAITAVSAIHAQVEEKRGASIPDWAYRDVLYMLVDYSIRSFEALERKLSTAEKEEVFDVFIRLGAGMGIQGLPTSLATWYVQREQHLKENLIYSHHTADLFKQYKKHLGRIRYYILLGVQKQLVPRQVSTLLHFHSFIIIGPLLYLYKVTRFIKLNWLMKAMLLPSQYKKQISAIEEKV